MTSFDTPKQDTALNYLWWVVSIMLITLGLMCIKDGWLATIPLVIIGTVINPKSYDHILQKINLSDPINLRMGITLITLVSATYTYFNHSESIAIEREAEIVRQKQEHQAQLRAQAEEEKRLRAEKSAADFKANKVQIISSLETAIDSRNIAEAKRLIDSYKEFSKDEDISRLVVKYDNAIKEINNRMRANELHQRLRTIQPSDYIDAISFYKELSILEPSDPSYKEKAARFTAIEQQKRVADLEEAGKMAERKAEREAEKLRIKQIESQFSSWSGAHRNLEKLIKAAMNDPDSFDHVETTYIDLGDRIRVHTKFRGKNAYGGVVLDSTTAEFDLSGNFIREIN